MGNFFFLKKLVQRPWSDLRKRLWSVKRRPGRRVQGPPQPSLAGNQAVNARLSARRRAGALWEAGGGRPLDQTTRAAMERRLRRNLAPVRIHEGSAIRETARELGARAFTHGSDIFLGEDRRSGPGRERDPLLAHELVHALQSMGHGKAPAERLSRPSEPAEVETDAAARAVLAGETVRLSRPACPHTIYRQVTAEFPELMEGGLWIVGPYAEVALDILNDLTGLSLFLDSDGKVFIDPTQAAVGPGTSPYAAGLIQEIANQDRVRVVIDAALFSAQGIYGAFDEPAGTGRQQVDIPDIEAAHHPPAFHQGATLFHEVAEAYFGRLIEGDPVLMGWEESPYAVAHPLALEAENQVRAELGLPAREPDSFPLIQLPKSLTGSSRPLAIMIDVYASHFQVTLVSQERSSGDITVEQTVLVERTIEHIDWQRDWQTIVMEAAPRLQFPR